MNIGILIICIGKYTVFFKDLYESAEKFFLKSHKKTYYVFTDGEIEEFKNVKKIFQKNLGWPNNTMARFEIFDESKLMLLGEDYLFFLNANMLFVDTVGDEVLPKEENDFLMGVNHPGFYNQDIDTFTYERNSKSEFYIPYGQGKYYYQGCFNGGSSSKFLEMSEHLSKKINLDLSKNIIPIWHDESALNWYYLNKNPLIMDSGYSYPEHWNIPFIKKIVQRNKQDYGGYNFLRH